MFPKIHPLYLLACLAATTPLHAATVNLPADRDATLIEDTYGGRANGSGPAFFAGRTDQAEDALRRAVLRFDVAGALPQQAIIDRVFLSLYQTSNSNTDGHEVALHRVLQDWSEGPAFSSGGGGAPAGPGDVTWLHTDYAEQYWVQDGGHYVQHPSATTTVRGAEFYTWQSSVNLVNDVRIWLHAPQQNFGWLLIGNEQTPQSSKRFASREVSNADQRPLLTIEYHLPGE